ncbi:MAG: GGDEF domain-containing protein [Chloroflexaceae bacterium]|nr:GGDEF domain-containing protein [Chloroflexaceae bacterium]
MIDYLDQERSSFETQRRHVYRIAGALGLLVVLYAQYTLLGDTLTPYIFRAIYSLNHILLAGFTVIILWQLARRRVSLEQIERRMLFFFIFQALFFNGIFPVLFNPAPGKVLAETYGDDIWFLLATCTLAIHFYPSWRGVALALGVYILSVAIVAAQVVQWQLNGIDDGSGARIIQIYTLGGMLLGFMLVMASYRNRLIRIQTEYELLAAIAYTDGLTGLPNRRQLYRDLNRLIAEAERYGHAFCVCLFDVDHFKRINDQYGHMVGDQALRAVGDTVRANLRVVDYFGRWGGEEYCILSPHTNVDQAFSALERVRLALREITDVPIPISASFGVAVYRPGDSAETLLHRADAAMYRAKRNGRDRIESESLEGSDSNHLVGLRQ